MTAFELTTFGGVSIGPGTVYNCMLAEEDDIVVSSEVASVLRRSVGPLVQGVASPGRVIVIRSDGPDNDDPAAASYRRNIDKWFDPVKNADGLRYLERYADDGETLIRIACIVTEKRFSGRGANAYVITLFAPAENWEAAELSTSGSNPTTVENAGNSVAYPVVRMANGTHVKRRAYTVVGAGAGEGLIAYPVRLDLEVNSVAITSSSTADPAVITTGAAHGLTTGDTVFIGGHSDASINGTWTATVTSSTTFTIPVNGINGGAGTGGTMVGGLDASWDGLTAENFTVYIEGVSVPFYISLDPAVYIWVLVDTDADGVTETHIDVIYGAGISNPLANTLNDGGMDWADPVTCHNTQWAWDDFSVATLRSNPTRPGAWRYALAGNHHADADVSYGQLDGTTNVSLQIAAAGTYNNTVDSILLDVGATAGTTNALSNFQRSTSNFDGTNARAFVRYRVANSTAWPTAWSTAANGTVTTAIDLDNAVQIVAGIENFGSTADPSGVGFVPVSTTNVTLALANSPTVVVGADEDFDYYDGILTINGRSIEFTEYLVPDGELTIDAATRDIRSSVDGPFYGPDEEDRQAYAFSHPDRWFTLNPGSNAVSNTTGADLTIEWRDAYG